MKLFSKSLLIAGLLATAGFAAYSQSPMAACDAMGGHEAYGMRHGFDSGRMAEWATRRLAELKTKLNITPAQEVAWTAFTTAMKPPAASTNARPDRAELDKLSTPERIDRMHALRTQHLADITATMDRYENATKAFYATLSAEQKKTFDAEHARMGDRAEHMMKK